MCQEQNEGEMPFRDRYSPVSLEDPGGKSLQFLSLESQPSLPSFLT